MGTRLLASLSFRKRLLFWLRHELAGGAVCGSVHDKSAIRHLDADERLNEDVHVH